MKTTIRKVAQKCPVCNGRKAMPSDFYNTNPFATISEISINPVPCQTCNGTGVLWSEERIEESEVELIEEKWTPKRGEYIKVKINFSTNWFVIFREIEKEKLIDYCAYALDDSKIYYNGPLCNLGNILEQSPCTPEEINQLDEALAKEGKRFDKEKMELVDLPKEPIIGRPAIMWDGREQEAIMSKYEGEDEDGGHRANDMTPYKNAILCESLEQYLEFIKE